MLDFFQGQIDYVYFLYGLSFLILAAISFSRTFEKDRTLPWVWLAFFGLIHGIYEWLDIASLLFPGNVALSSVSILFLSVSYLCLLEFARKAFFTLAGRTFPQWLYIPLLLCAATASAYGEAGIKGALRYFLCFPAGILFVLVIRNFSVQISQRPLQRPLTVLAAAFGLYSLLSGLIVSPSGFFLARWINSDSFKAFFQFPVQVLRGLTALAAACALWIYSERSKELATKTRRFPLRLQVSTWLMAILIMIIVFGWVFVNQLGENARRNLVSDVRIELNDLEYGLLAELTKSEQAAMTISGSPWIPPALVAGLPQDLANANSVLSRYKRAFALTECFLLDATGTSVAASNWSDPDSYIGKVYRDAPYFIESMRGKLGNHFQFEPGCSQRCYYASFPVYNEEAMVIGAVVMKKNIDILEKDFTRWPHCFFIDSRGRVFLSSQNSLRSKNLWPLEPSSSAKSGLSGNLRETPLSKEVSDGDTADFGSERFFVLRQFIGRQGWSILLLLPTKLFLNARLFGLLSVLFLSVMVIAFFIAVRQRENLLSIVSSVNAQIKTVLDAATHVSIIATELHGLITVFNTGAEKMLGYTAADMVEMHTPEVLFPESELIHRGKELSLEYGYSVSGFEVLIVHAKHGRSQEQEWTYVRKDGNTLTVNLSVTAQRDHKGEITGFLFVAMDITERKVAEYRLSEQKEFTENLVQNSALATFVLDAQHNVIFWNKACEELTGIKSSRMIGSKDAWKAFYKEKRPVLADFFISHNPEDLAQFYKSSGRSALNSKGWRAEDWYEALNGKDRYLMFEAVPLYNAKNELIAVIETLQDITERKRAEEVLARQAQELARSNTELERFAYVASHDLQEPLRMVTSYVQLIEKRYKGMLDKDANEFIAFAVDGVNWMQSLINALLTYSRVGTHRKEFETVDCNEVRERALKNLQVAIEESKAVIVSDQLPVVIADSSQLTQLFQNLIGNAIKFRRDEAPRVQIGAKKTGNEWVFSVADNGIGIDPQYFSRMFEIFQRLHPRKEYPGTGIGLAVCKKIVEQHGGRIWVESAPRQGTTFYFAIPLTRS